MGENIIFPEVFFSLIIPTCNRNELLGKCLDKLGPDLQRVDKCFYEILVTDDGKNNNAKFFLESKYSRVQWLLGPKKGPAANRNNGAKAAKGKWLIFLDDDCIPDADLLGTYKEDIKKNPEISVFEGKICKDGKKNSPIEHAPINENGGHLWSCNFCISKKDFLLIGGFDENFKYPHLEDIDFRDRVLKAGLLIYFSNNSFVLHPWRKSSNGKTLGLYHESDIYYYHRKLGCQLKLNKLLLKILISRLGSIKVHFFSKDTPIAFKLLAEELWIVLLYFNRWTKKYPII